MESEYIFYAKNGNKEFVVKSDGTVINCREDIYHQLEALTRGLAGGLQYGSILENLFP